MRKTIRRRLARGALLSSLLLTSSCFATAPAHAAAPGPTVSIGDADVIEGDAGSNDLVFEVTLSSGTGKIVTVDWSTGGGDATPGTDYQSSSGTITFNKKETVKTVRVPVLGDEVDEADETLVVTLRRPGGAVVGDGAGTGLIRDDDDAPPPPPSSTLTVSRAGEGAGTVTSSPAGIDCGPTCSAEYDDGTAVTLTATPSTGSTFSGWSGACTGTATTCTVSMDGDRAVTATFAAAPATARLSVELIGEPTCTADLLTCTTPSGAVVSDPEGIACDANAGACQADFVSGTVVTLTALTGDAYLCTAIGTPAELCLPSGQPSTFTGWGGACAHAGSGPTCTVTVNVATDVTATFAA